jgi:exo-beta-1,3-glucanase (GH17 family)
MFFNQTTRLRINLWVATLWLFCISSATGAPICATQGTSIKRLQDAMAQGRFIAYQPTELKVINGKPTQASRASIAEDLRVLRSTFDGLITYGSHSGGELIADVAASLKFRAIIIGVWNVRDAQEVANAVASWRRNPELVVGVSFGNETVFGKREGFESLAGLLAKLRASNPGLPVATTEPFHLWTDKGSSPVMKQMDFMLANVHPIFQPWFKEKGDDVAAQFVVNVGRELATKFCGPVVIKETGIPTAPIEQGFSAERQASFYKELRLRLPPTRTMAFAYFSAFDASWRVADAHPTPGFHPEEAHFGLYFEDRRPKKVLSIIPTLHPR